jgi:hypothetical protein
MRRREQIEGGFPPRVLYFTLTEHGIAEARRTLAEAGR